MPKSLLLLCCFLLLALNLPATVGPASQLQPLSNRASLELTVAERPMVIQHAPSEQRSDRRIARAFKRAFDAPGDSPTSGFAVASLVCGIVGLLFAGIILGALAIVFGAIALKRIKTYGQRGRGMPSPDS